MIDRFGKSLTLALMIAAAPAMAQETTPAPAPAPATTDGASPATTAANPVVGGAEMLPSRNIIQNASQSAEHRTLVRAVQAANLVATLEGPGPFTVFAPTDQAFAALPAGTLDGLLQPQNQATLTQILTYHVVPQRVTFADIEAAMEAGGGTATYTTVNGQPITISRQGNALRVAGQNGSVGFVGQYDVAQSNGVIHVINGVLVPNIQAPAAGATTPATPGTAAPAGQPTTPAQPGS
ncbi:putative surface protein with fasciclin (FAS1) repeats [Sphingomonas jejuensis]|uniref:Surface protein with fasciclin (FAS1) repeats n=1 Tax=Sphingomonas jejuensis TaxID=904715 RepID=A0ABX0XLL8_9SPHN|nr:fasciclin domain-containing protein [Sphingomonas jejuensis]NJC34058.1 putative surface protein with fasciclin (FAS1) repeats [Sphingomonas jejuensis]